MKLRGTRTMWHRLNSIRQGPSQEWTGFESISVNHLLFIHITIGFIISHLPDYFLTKFCHFYFVSLLWNISPLQPYFFIWPTSAGVDCPLAEFVFFPIFLITRWHQTETWFLNAGGSFRMSQCRERMPIFFFYKFFCFFFSKKIFSFVVFSSLSLACLFFPLSVSFCPVFSMKTTRREIVCHFFHIFQQFLFHLEPLHSLLCPKLVNFFFFSKNLNSEAIFFWVTSLTLSIRDAWTEFPRPLTPPTSTCPAPLVLCLGQVQ